MTLIFAPVSLPKPGLRRCSGSAICGPVNVNTFTVTPSNGFGAAVTAGTDSNAAANSSVSEIPANRFTLLTSWSSPNDWLFRMPCNRLPLIRPAGGERSSGCAWTPQASFCRAQRRTRKRIGSHSRGNLSVDFPTHLSHSCQGTPQPAGFPCAPGDQHRRRPPGVGEMKGRGPCRKGVQCRPKACLSDGVPEVEVMAAKRLRLLLVGGLMYDPLYGGLDEFERQTGWGIEVAARLPHPALNARIAEEFGAGTARYDLISTHTKYAASQRQWLTPLDDDLGVDELAAFYARVLQLARIDGLLFGR